MTFPIKNLFDPSKDIYRTIEKVITYGASQESRLRAEITEYVVTAHIEEQFERLLSRMQMAMDSGGGNEVGVWVSGFYGSGKSSFTKYLGMALDARVSVDGTRFLKHLQDRLNTPQTRALLTTITSRYATAVVLLDLASEMLAGATMEDVSTVLYYKVLQWAGYSSNLKVAALERRLKRDNRYPEFLDRILTHTGVPWPEVKDDPLVIDSLIPDIAHALYPQLFTSSAAFTTEAGDFVRFENERVREMIQIVREHTGTPYIIFIIDEVGQYVGARPNLILNLDGLAKNLKEIGDGKVWIMGTAQQTLTEDDEKTALNSPELYKLKDRFPIQINLESSDIKEICYRRLLGKSPDGEHHLGALFDQHGQVLRHTTKLQNAPVAYNAECDRLSFVNLYPFLPSHFEILLRLLGALAKSTGGIGLRSAIKVIQDILVEGPAGRDPVADQPLGWLATTVTLYDALERDIRRAVPSLHKAVDRAKERFPEKPVHQGVAKTVAILQILASMPVTPQNVASLMHPAVDAPSQRDGVDAAIADLTHDSFVPFGEKEGNLCFFSEKLNEIDQERLLFPIRGPDTRRIQSDGLREVFSPLPTARLENTLVVTAGLKSQIGSQAVSVTGERETIQLVAELVAAPEYETARSRLVAESRQRSAQHTIFVLGRAASEVESRAAEISRSEAINQKYRNDPDKEVQDYCRAQQARADRLKSDLERLIRRQLSQGSFFFRGGQAAVESLNSNLLDAAKIYLADVAAQVYDRYHEAPVRVETGLAEKFLRAGNLKAVTVAIDPLQFVTVTSGRPSIDTNQKSLVSIRDYLQQNGTVDGKRLTDLFTDAPFGWSPDTLRYLVAALLVAGEITLKVSGREVTVNGQQAIDALRTNQAFKTVGVALRNERPSNEVLARAAERLTEIIGESIIPLEDDISKAATHHFPTLQQRYSPLAVRLESLGLPGCETVRALSQDLADVLLTDASDAPQRLGGVTSALYERLHWARAVDVALSHGLEATVRDLQQHRQTIAALPASGIPGHLRDDLAEDLALLGQRLADEGFVRHAADLRSTLTAIRTRVATAVSQLAAAQAVAIHEAQQNLQQFPGWTELTQEEQTAQVATFDALTTNATDDLAGLRQLLNREFELQERVRQTKHGIEHLANQRRADREFLERERHKKEAREYHDPVRHAISIPARVRSAERLNALIEQLEALRSAFAYPQTHDVEVTIEVVSDQ